MLLINNKISVYFDHGRLLSRDAGTTAGVPKKIKTEFRTYIGTRSGRYPSNIDRSLNGIWWILKTGSMWRALPERYGKWNSVWRCFRRWCESGLWPWVLERLEENFKSYRLALIVDASHVKAHQDATRSPLDPHDQKLGKTKGGRNTKLSACVNLAGRAVKIVLAPGNEHDSKSFNETLPVDIENCFVLADKGYDTDAIRTDLEARRAFTVIPPKTNRTKEIPYDKEVGKLRRKVENFFCRIKRYRRVNTRYDQLPITYLGFVNLSAIADYAIFKFVHAA
jgi:transposase